MTSAAITVCRLARRRGGRPVLAAAVLALFAAGSAHAAPWTVTETDPAVGPAQPVSVAGDGRILAAGAQCGASACETVLATRPHDGTFGVAGRVMGALEAAVPLRDGRALLITAPPSHRGLTAFDLTPAGRVVRAGTLERRHARDPVAASDRRGTTVVAWLTSIAPRRLRARVRRHDGAAFGPARTLATFARDGDFGGGAVAVGPRGEIAVVWVANGALQARVQRPGARRFGTVLRGGPSDRQGTVAATFTARGRLVTIWNTADGGEEQNRVAIARVGSLGPGAHRFAPPRRLGEAAGRGATVGAVATGHTALIAWTSRSKRVRVGTVHADGTLTAVRGLDANGVLAAATASPAGHALLAWTHDPAGPDAGARAALVLPGPHLGIGEPAGPAGSWATSAALDDTGARAVVGWGAGDAVIAPRWGIAERAVDGDPMAARSRGARFETTSDQGGSL